MSTILDKIRKLLALSKSHNVNEAAAAAAAAQRLMSEHRIAEAELQGDDKPQERAAVAGEPIDDCEGPAPRWKGGLCNHLAQLHGCKTWTRTTITNGRRRNAFQIVGRPSDVASVRYLYAWLTSEIERLTQRNGMGKGRTSANSYRWGAVVGCLASMGDANSAARSKATGEALVRLDARAIESQAVLDAQNLRLRASSGRSRFDGDAFERGKKAGGGLHAGSRLGAVRGARLLGSG